MGISVTYIMTYVKMNRDYRAELKEFSFSRENRHDESSVGLDQFVEIFLDVARLQESNAWCGHGLYLTQPVISRIYRDAECGRDAKACSHDTVTIDHFVELEGDDLHVEMISASRAA